MCGTRMWPVGPRVDGGGPWCPQARVQLSALRPAGLSCFLAWWPSRWRGLCRALPVSAAHRSRAFSFLGSLLCPCLALDCRPTASCDSWSPPGGLTSTSPGLSGEGGGPSPLLISLVSLVQPPQAGQTQVASSEGSPDSTGRMAQTSSRPCPQSALLGIAAQRLHSPGDSPASAVLPHKPWSRPTRPSRLDAGLVLPLRA